jgi:hydrogenase maturation protease
MNVRQQRILVAGIGNIFLGDDGFGVEVVRRLAEQQLPAEVGVRDFGIRGFDVAYALNETWETVILVDALSRGQQPGTIFVVEPSLDDLERSFDGSGIQPHGMDPLQAVRLAKSLGQLPQRLLIVGCEPADLGGEDGRMGLSPVVQAAVELAAQTVVQLVTEALAATPRVKEQRNEVSSIV